MGRDSLNPCRLVELKGSSWEYFTLEPYREEPTLDIPTCLVGYANGVSGETGLLSRYSRNGDEKVRRLCRFTGTRWLLLNDDARKSNLQKILNQQLSLSEDVVESTISMVLTIADNPTLGATFVFIDPEYRNSISEVFVRMGTPWEIEPLTFDDKLSLSAHDGATLVEIESDLWKPRYLLTGNGLPEGRIAAFGRASATAEGVLNGAGGRRWSSALCAAQEGVNCVIAVSQDGDIYAFRGNDKEEPVECMRLSPNESEYEWESLWEI